MYDRPLDLRRAAGLALARAAGKRGSKTHSPLASRNLWATIDICSSASGQDTLGIRGSMPGTGPFMEMYMRFRVEFWSSDHHWHFVRTQADSGYKAVGSARYVLRQSGWSFLFPPPSGGSFTLRGVVDFEWRKRTQVVLHTRLATSAGHSSVIGSQPPGYTAATCALH